MRPTSLSVRDFRPLPRALPADTGAPPGARRTLPYPKNEPLYARGGANASARCPARTPGSGWEPGAYVLQSFDSEADGGPSAAIAGNSTKSIEDTLASPIAGQPLVLGPTGGNVAPQAAGLYIMARAPGRPADQRRAALDLRSSARARRRPRRWPPDSGLPVCVRAPAL